MEEIITYLENIETFSLGIKLLSRVYDLECFDKYENEDYISVRLRMNKFSTMQKEKIFSKKIKCSPHSQNLTLYLTSYLDKDEIEHPYLIVRLMK